MTNSSGYEFNSSQNDIFKDLANKMRFVGVLLLISGIISLILGIFVTLSWISIQKEDVPINSGITSIIQGVFILSIGIWTRKAAVGFSRIVKTTNNDIENLMIAMGELRKLYTLQYVLAIITVVIIGLVFILSIIEALSAAIN